MKIYLGADHAGFELKTQIYEHLVHSGHEVEDLGARTLDEDDDYPQYAYAVATKILGGNEDDCGILLCGSGQGMSIAANRVNGIRATLAWNTLSAVAGKEDDDSNILVLPARFVGPEIAFEMVDKWLKAKFKADPKYKHRLDELGDIRA
jgi:ribose 5-phosphate isomerase B